jgi:hypothetical protein
MKASVQKLNFIRVFISAKSEVKYRGSIEKRGRETNSAGIFQSGKAIRASAYTKKLTVAKTTCLLTTIEPREIILEEFFPSLRFGHPNRNIINRCREIHIIHCPLHIKQDIVVPSNASSPIQEIYIKINAKPYINLNIFNIL